MIYRSNLEAPDLVPCFRHVTSRPMAHSHGHDVLSDWADKPDDEVWRVWKQCGFWTHDEAAILYHIASACRGLWIDIGAHTGWTTAHLLAAGCQVFAVERNAAPAFRERFWANLAACGHPWPCERAMFLDCDSSVFLSSVKDGILLFDGVIVDGDHDPPAPVEDALAAAAVLAPTGVILLHDGTGGPVQDAARELSHLGFRVQRYLTPHIIYACVRGEVRLPDHVPDPAIAKRFAARAG